MNLAPRPAAATPAADSANMESLSPEKRALLLQRLRRRQPEAR